MRKMKHYTEPRKKYPTYDKKGRLNGLLTLIFHDHAAMFHYENKTKWYEGTCICSKFTYFHTHLLILFPWRLETSYTVTDLYDKLLKERWKQKKTRKKTQAAARRL